MDAIQSYEDRRRSVRARWIRPLDEAHMAVLVRKSMERLAYDERDILRRIESEIDRVATEMEYAHGEFSSYLMRIIVIATDNAILVVERDKRGVLPLGIYLEKVETFLADRESEATEEWPIDKEAHDIARKALQLTPYQIFCFRQAVLNAAVEAAKENALDLLDGENPGRSMIEHVDRAAKAWVNDWRK